MTPTVPDEDVCTVCDGDLTNTGSGWLHLDDGKPECRRELTTPTSAIAVSRFLRRAGFLPVPTSRAGVHVKRHPGGAYVAVSLDGSRIVDESVYADVEAALVAGGYAVRRASSVSGYVAGRVSA